MKRLVAAALFVACGSFSAFAGPIEDRQQLMKNIQAATKDGAALARGTTPFDAAKAKAVLQVYIDGAKKLPALFPKKSKTGSKTTADPKIWTDPAGFKAASKKFGDDANEALAATDTASFNTGFIAITKDCGSCHGAYRTKPQ